MECKHAEVLIADYAKGSIDKEHSTILKGHLKNCFTCSQLFKGRKFAKYLVKGVILLFIMAISIVTIVHAPHKEDIDLEGAKKRVISNIIIEVLYKDKASNIKTVEDFVKSFSAEIVEENPLSVKLEKHKVNEFVEQLHEILIFPEHADDEISVFMQPLDDSDEVIIKIKFLEKMEETV